MFYLSRAIDVHYYCVFSLNYFTSLVYFLPHFFSPIIKALSPEHSGEFHFRVKQKRFDKLLLGR